ncbi:MAG TPA: RHS repeat-associated core domain-containing protein [Solirubrobacterales bacterium]|nr:RHS repeat-associated core domain-containing protein [Solirubrobacterales bacterium]
MTEAWNWTDSNESQAAWVPSSNDPGLAYFNHAIWEGSGNAPGLDLSSAGWGNDFVGGQAQWVYAVPRLNEDYSRFGSYPTTWLYQLWTENDWFLNYADTSTYPAMIVGLAAPGSAGWWTHDNVWYGYYGAATGIPLGSEDPPLSAEHAATKAADFAYVTYENETPARHRDAYVGRAAVAVVDEDAPKPPTLTAPTGWLTGPTARSIGYSLEDTGLGVKWAQVRLAGEKEPHAGWGAAFPCIGTDASPCPRLAASTETGRPAVTFVPGELPTGRDILEVGAVDPLGHVGTANVAVMVDNTAPEITLSGALTEQEKLGITKAEYPLTISATDGFEDDPPQSGVSTVEVKVDGKKVATPYATPCKEKDCSFTGSWTLKASEYAAGDHEVEVIATDAVGHRSVETLEVELGTVPPQTSFTSPHPSFEEHEIPDIAFKATKGGLPVEGATFRCSIDGATAEPCRSPHQMPHLAPNAWHTFDVFAIDKEGKRDPTAAFWTFKPGTYPDKPASTGDQLVYPEAGKKTASHYTLEARWGEAPAGGKGVTGVSFQVELPGAAPAGSSEPTFETIPAECVVDGQGDQVSWPLPAHGHPGHSAPVYLKVRGCPLFAEAGYPEKEIRFRAVFDGEGAVAGASEPAATEFVSAYNANRVSTDATETVGPATVDLLTGAYSLSRTDVSIPVPGYEANLEFTRTFSSTIDSSLPGFSQVMGGAWQPGSPLESESEGESWTRIEEKVIPYRGPVYGHYCWQTMTETWEEEGVTGSETWEEEEACPSNVESNCPPQSCEKWLEEEAQPEERWIELFDNEGAGIPFEISGEKIIAPEWASEISLSHEGNNIVLAYPNGTHTIFTGGGEYGPAERVWTPTQISYQANSKSMRMIYELGPKGEKEELLAEIAPSPVTCPDEAMHTPGCRMLQFNYGHGGESELPLGELFCWTSWSWIEDRLVGEGCPTLLKSIEYFGPSGSGVGQTVAKYRYENIPKGITGKPEAVLLSESDPRTGLTEEYSYEESSYRLRSLTPPGQAPWEFSYLPAEGPAVGGKRKLKSVGRAGATTTIAYEVPVSGSGAPYDMSSANIAGWGETDLPVDATAIFPPNHVPAEYPPHFYTGATIDYMDPEGYEINTASPSPPGVVGNSISTTETDVHGNVVRELDPQNRLIALNSPNPPVRSHELDTHSVWSPNGNEELESWGPLHLIRLASGEPVEARAHTVTRYDEGEETPPVGTPWAYLPTKETVAAVIPGKSGEVEPRTTQTKYDWTLRLPTETVVDPGGLNIQTVTKYNPVGQVEETRQPKGPNGGTAGTTHTVYYSAGPNAEWIGCGEKPAYANLPCMTLPAKQVFGTNRPEIVDKVFAEYKQDEPTKVIESPGAGASNQRITSITYDEAGRPIKTKISGGGVELARTNASTETQYGTQGMPTKQQFVCEATNCTGFDSQATTTTYNALGQVTKYEDADGNVTKSTYDGYGRPVTVTDGEGTQTLHYDEETNAVTSMQLSGVGTFTATYDADGDLLERGLPNGLTATTTYNQAGEPTKLAYTKGSCGPSCTWYEESLERSIEGQILAGKSSLVSNQYLYDAAGRLTEARESPTGTGAKCTTRHYTYDADSNRLIKATRPPGPGGECVTSGGEIQEYKYDAADRLEGPTYDPWGRITSLPAGFAGGKALTTEYFANDMVAKQTQNLVSNTFQLDATGRQRQREQTGGVTGIEVFHYDGPSDVVAWFQLGSTWTRDIIGFGGELAAVQESSGSTTFKLTDLHGDVVASASSNPAATELLAKYRFTEFGEPVAGISGRFGWLGGQSRRTELASGVIQMGARSYVPQLGRFLTPDSVSGGSANPYDYAEQDPVNDFDLAGTCSGKRCPERAAVNHAPKKKAGRAHSERSHAHPGRAKRISLSGIVQTVGRIASRADPTAGKIAEAAVNVVLNHNPAVVTVTSLQAAARHAASYIIEGLSAPIKSAAASCDNAFVKAFWKETQNHGADAKAAREGAYACAGAWLGSLF